MRRASIWIAGLIALGGCRQVFGIDEPLPSRNPIADARSDGRAALIDGSMTPAGLAMYVDDGVALWDNDQPPDVAWALIDPAHAHADLWKGDALSIVDLLLDGVTGHEPYTVWMDGQVHLTAGTQQLQLMASSYGFFDVELTPNSGSFTRIASSRNDASQPRMITVPADDWYRVRMGWTSSTNAGTADFAVLHMPAAFSSGMPFTASELRH